MNLENILSTFIALVAIVGACLVISIPIVFIAYECKRFYLFLRRAFMRRRPAHAMPMTLKEVPR